MGRFELPYVSTPIAQELLKSWEQPGEAVSKGLALPPRNHYIPTDFTLVSAKASSNGQAKAAATALLHGFAQPLQVETLLEQTLLFTGEHAHVCETDRLNQGCAYGVRCL